MTKGSWLEQRKAMAEASAKAEEALLAQRKTEMDAAKEAQMDRLKLPQVDSRRIPETPKEGHGRRAEEESEINQSGIRIDIPLLQPPSQNVNDPPRKLEELFIARHKLEGALKQRGVEPQAITDARKRKDEARNNLMAIDQDEQLAQQPQVLAPITRGPTAQRNQSQSSSYADLSSATRPQDIRRAAMNEVTQPTRQQKAHAAIIALTATSPPRPPSHTRPGTGRASGLNATNSKTTPKQPTGGRGS